MKLNKYLRFLMNCSCSGESNQGLSILECYEKGINCQKFEMEKKYFALSAPENNKLVKIIQIAFGLVCFGVAVFWLFFNIRSLKADKTLWITILFLCGFGFYQIWSGLGRAARFIEISSEKIRIKKPLSSPQLKFTRLTFQNRAIPT